MFYAIASRADGGMIMRHMNIPMNLPLALEKYFTHVFNEFLPLIITFTFSAGKQQIGNKFL